MIRGDISLDKYVKKKKDMIFQNVESLQQVVNVVNEAAAAVNDKSRTIRESAIPEVLGGVDVYKRQVLFHTMRKREAEISPKRMFQHID